jgi:hypothetical protein
MEMNIKANVDSCKTPEETNLIRKIEGRAKNLIQSLSSIEGVTKGLNKNLLPQLPKDESKVGVDQRPPQGWLECHLADLDHALYRCGQIYDEVSRLLKETQIDKVGQ